MLFWELAWGWRPHTYYKFLPQCTLLFFSCLKTGAQLELNVSLAESVSPYKAGVSGQTTIWALDPTHVADDGLNKEVNAEASNQSDIVCFWTNTETILVYINSSVYTNSSQLEQKKSSVKTLHPVIGLQFRFHLLKIIHCLVNFVNAKQRHTGV